MANQLCTAKYYPQFVVGNLHVRYDLAQLTAQRIAKACLAESENALTCLQCNGIVSD
ncbi:MAG: hypothetical protein QM813_06485 [Verrucomicrobiota bacterium]